MFLLIHVLKIELINYSNCGLPLFVYTVNYLYYTSTVSTKNDHINVSNYYMYYKVGT